MKSNEETRLELASAVDLFLKNRCFYSYEEQKAVEAVKEILQPVDPACEAINKKHPNHGLKNNINENY